MWCHFKTLNHLPHSFSSPHPLLLAKDQAPIWILFLLTQILFHEGVTVLSCKALAVFTHGSFSSVFKTWSMHVVLKVKLGASSQHFWKHDLIPSCLCVQMLVLIKVSCSWLILVLLLEFNKFFPFCSSTTTTITLVHPLLVWMLVLFN